MIHNSLAFFLLTLLVITTSCTENSPQPSAPSIALAPTFEEEKVAIINTLNNETKAAFQRDYEAWTKNWVHDPTITKTYLNFTDTTFSESMGWAEISNFVKTYIEEHPEPEPIPTLLDDVEVRLYGKGAWVSYEQQDALRGRKRETRLMEKENGQWKIAGMQTTIYGFEDK